MLHAQEVAKLIADTRDRLCPPTNYIDRFRCNRSVTIKFPLADHVDIYNSVPYSLATSPNFVKLNIFGRSTDDKERNLVILKEAATSTEKEFENVDEDFLSYILSDSPKELPGIHGSLLYFQVPKEDHNFSCDHRTPEGRPELVSSLLRLQESTVFPLLVIELSLEQETCIVEHKSSFPESSVVKLTKLPGGEAVYAIRTIDHKAGNVEPIADVKLLHSPGVPTVQSLRQFDFILAQGGHMLHRLKKFIGGRQVGYSSEDEMVLLACAKRVVRDGGSDPEVYQAIRNTFHSEIACKYKKPASKDQKSAGRPDNRVKHIVNLLPQSFRPRTLLDVGCAEGSITSSIGSALGLSRRDTHGCDIRDISASASGFTFRLLQPSVPSSSSPQALPYGDDSFCLVTALMSLHHIKDQEQILSEIFRLLRPGGIFVIREHNCEPKELAAVLDVMHGLFALVWDEVPESPQFIEEYYAHYRSREQWDQMITASGMFRMRTSRNDKEYEFGATSPFPDKALEEVNPQNAYYVCYQKPHERRSLGTHAESSQQNHWQHGSKRNTDRQSTTEDKRHKYDSDYRSNKSSGGYQRESEGGYHEYQDRYYDKRSSSRYRQDRSS